MKSRAYDEETIATIVAMRKAGKSFTEIGKATGLSGSWVAVLWRREAGLEPRPKAVGRPVKVNVQQCSARDCEREVRARKLCGRHYQQALWGSRGD